MKHAVSLQLTVKHYSDDICTHKTLLIVQATLAEKCAHWLKQISVSTI